MTDAQLKATTDHLLILIEGFYTISTQLSH